MNTKYQGLQRARAYGMSRTFARISETHAKFRTKSLVHGQSSRTVDRSRFLTNQKKKLLAVNAKMFFSL